MRAAPLGLVLFLTFESGAAYAAPEGDIIAVFDIDASDLRSFNADKINKFSVLLDAVVAASGYRTVPRAEIRGRITEQQEKTFEPCYDEACQIELGRALAAQKVLSSTWARLGESCTLTIRIYDLRSAVSEFSTKSDASCDDVGLRSAIEGIATALRARSQPSYGAFALDLDAGRAIKNPPTDRTGFLRVRAVAKGSSEKIEVYINGELSGSSGLGLFFTKDLPLGRYIIVLRTAGDLFAHQRFDIEMTPNGVDIPASGVAELQPTFGTLIIEGSPAQALAIIEGERRRIDNPFREDRPAGDYLVIIEAPGYVASAPRTITINAGQTTRLAYALEKNVGSIAITGLPRKATVWLDGAELGSLPLSVASIDPGDHVVEVRAPGYHPVRRKASVLRGGRAVVDVNLVEKLARLKVEALTTISGERTPIEAEIYVDGHGAGTTPWKGEVRAEIPHSIELRLGELVASAPPIELKEGTEGRIIVEVPSSWGGAVSSVRFELDGSPVEVRSGQAILAPSEPNAVRAGRMRLEFYLHEKRIGAGTITVPPREERVVELLERPKTDEELERSRTIWTWRRWLSVGGATASGIVLVERTIAAHRAEASRDAAYRALMGSSVSDDVDAYRADVMRFESDRVSAQNVASALAAAVIIFSGWSAYEWLFAEPERGQFRARGLDEVIP